MESQQLLEFCWDLRASHCSSMGPLHGAACLMMISIMGCRGICLVPEAPPPSFSLTWGLQGLRVLRIFSLLAVAAIVAAQKTGIDCVGRGGTF